MRTDAAEAYRPPRPVAEPPTAAGTVDDGPREFFPPSGHRFRTLASIAGGAILIAVGLIAFVVTLAAGVDVGPIQLQIMTTAPMIGGIFMAATAWMNRQCPSAIRLWPQGLEVYEQSDQPPRTIAFADVDRVVSGMTFQAGKEPLHLVAADGERLATIPASIKGYKDLRRAIRAGVESLRPADVAGPPAGKRSWKHVLGYGFGAAVTLAMAIGAAVMGAIERRDAAAMESRGVTGTGVVTEKKIAPNGQTKRLYVRVAGNDGTTEIHNFEVTEAKYNAVEVGDEVAVRSVPDDPGVAELTSGQVDNRDAVAFETPWMNYAMVAIFAFMAIAAAGMTVLSWQGYDLQFEDGKFFRTPLA